MPRLLYTVIFLFLSVCCHAQDTVYRSLNKAIISVSPVAMTEWGLGFGTAIEIPFGDEKRTSVILPVNVIFMDDLFIFNRNSNNVMHFAPGIKYYAGKNRRRVSYAYGPHLWAEVGKRKESHGRVGGYYDAPVRTFGIIFNNSLNIFPGKHIYMGLDIGLGLPFFVRGPYIPLIHGNFRVGYHFGTRGKGILL